METHAPVHLTTGGPDEDEEGVRLRAIMSRMRAGLAKPAMYLDRPVNVEEMMLTLFVEGCLDEASPVVTQARTGEGAAESRARIDKAIENSRHFGCHTALRMRTRNSPQDLAWPPNLEHDLHNLMLGAKLLVIISKFSPEGGMAERSTVVRARIVE